MTNQIGRRLVLAAATVGAAFAVGAFTTSAGAAPHHSKAWCGEDEVNYSICQSESGHPFKCPAGYFQVTVTGCARNPCPAGDTPTTTSTSLILCPPSAQEPFTVLAKKFRSDVHLIPQWHVLGTTCTFMDQGPVAPDTDRRGWPNGFPAQCTMSVRIVDGSKTSPATVVGSFVSYHDRWDLLEVTAYVAGVQTQKVQTKSAPR